VEAWIRKASLHPGDYLFPSRIHISAHIGTRQKKLRAVQLLLSHSRIDDSAVLGHQSRRRVGDGGTGRRGNDWGLLFC
jgi:hypothetical protein